MMKIFGITLTKIKYNTFLNGLIEENKQKSIFTPNPEILLKTLEDKNFKETLIKSDYLVPDGIGIYIAYQILSNKLKNKLGIFIIFFLPYYIFNILFRKKALYKKFGDKVCGSDLTKDIITLAQENNYKITIIDLYNPNDLDKVKSQETFEIKLKNKFPKLKFDYFIYNPKKEEEIISKIQNNNSKILFSTLGMKTQEESIIKIMKKATNIKLGLGVGSSFDYFIGFQKRAPKFWRNIGIEWLYRLIFGPQKVKRLKRLWNAIFVFIYKIIIYKD